MLAYPQVAKPLLELVLRATIIVRMEHTEEDALSETAWTYEEEVVCFLFQKWYIHCLVHVILVTFHDIYKV